MSILTRILGLGSKPSADPSEDVPGFTDILIHCSNTDEHTSGCILVGDSLSPGFLGSSRDAYGKVYPEVRDELLQGQEVVLEVISM